MAQPLNKIMNEFVFSDCQVGIRTISVVTENPTQIVLSQEGIYSLM